MVVGLLVLLLVLLLPPLRIEAAWTFTLAPYEEECFLFRTPSAMKSAKLLVGNYEMMDTDESGDGVSADPFLVFVMEATKEEKILFQSKPGQATGSFRVAVQPSKGYWMCLQNSSHGPDSREAEPEHPDHKTRLVGFSFNLQEFYTRPAPLAFTEDNESEWKEKSAAVEDELKMLLNHHEYMLVREANHRQIVENSFTSLMFWSLMEALVVILGAVGQVMYFRRFLEKKRYL